MRHFYSFYDYKLAWNYVFFKVGGLSWEKYALLDKTKSKIVSTRRPLQSFKMLVLISRGSCIMRYGRYSVDIYGH